MSKEFRLPELGESTNAALITKVMVSEGDRLEPDQAVIEVETDKAVVEVPVDTGGIVTRVHVKDGDEISPGDVVLTLNESGEAAPAKEAKPAAEAKPADDEKDAAGDEAPEETKAPAKADDQPAESREAVKTPEPRKAAPEKAPEKTPERAAASGTDVQERPVGAVVPAAPSVRRFAREIGIDIARVPASGAHGRVSVEDVKRFAKQLNESLSRQIPSGGPVIPPLPNFERWGEVRREPMTMIRRRTAEHMTLAWSQIPHVTQFDWANVTEMEELRKHFKTRAEKAGGRLTMTIVLAKVVASALKVFPRFNASLDVEKREILYKQYCNIGIAVDTEHGLLVPVVKDVDQKNMIQIAVEMDQLAEKARSRKIRPDELEGGSITITNLGSIGGTHFTPIVNYPEVAILGVGRAVLQPGFHEKDQLCKPHLMLPLSLSYDHRVIDGAEGIRFLRWIVEAMEEPLLLSLEG